MAEIPLQRWLIEQRRAHATNQARAAEARLFKAVLEETDTTVVEPLEEEVRRTQSNLKATLAQSE